MVFEQTVYSRAWLRERMKYFFRDAARSVAFGLIMSVSFFIILVGIFGLLNSLPVSGPDSEFVEAEAKLDPILILLWIFIGIPICVICWRGAIEVADDSHWEEKAPPSLWDNQEARMLESTLYLARQLEEGGKEIDMSMVMSDDIHSKAHELIDQLDAPALRLYMVALMGGLSEHKAINQQGHARRSAYLCEPEGDAETNE